MEFILHIGRHKTGTTALQNFLRQNEESLVGHGVLYPRTGRAGTPHHHAIFSRPIGSGGGISPSFVDAIAAERAVSGARRVVLSSEMLGRSRVPVDTVAAIRDSLSPARITVVCYLRRQDEYLMSAYAERVRRGLLAAPRDIRAVGPCLDYEKYLEKYVAVFGSDALVLGWYTGTDICRDFLRRIGIPKLEGFQYSDERFNRRLPWRYLEMLRHANASPGWRRLLAHPKVQDLARALERLLPGFMNRPEPLSPAERADLMTMLQDGNDRILRRIEAARPLWSP